MCMCIVPREMTSLHAKLSRYLKYCPGSELKNGGIFDEFGHFQGFNVVEEILLTHILRVTDILKMELRHRSTESGANLQVGKKKTRYYHHSFYRGLYTRHRI